MEEIEVGEWYEVLLTGSFYYGMVGMVKSTYPRVTELWFGSEVGTAKFYNKDLLYHVISAD